MTPEQEKFVEEIDKRGWYAAPGFNPNYLIECGWITQEEIDSAVDCPRCGSGDGLECPCDENGNYEPPS